MSLIKIYRHKGFIQLLTLVVTMSCSVQYQCTFLIFTVLFCLILCECEQSYMTICDNVEDIYNEDVKDVTELMIGSSKIKREDPTFFSLSSLKNLKKLKIFILLGQINRLDTKSSNFILSTDFDFVSLHGNELRQIHKSHFPQFSARKLSLTNNKIELIEKETFKNQKIEIIDLSDNLLEVVEAEVLPSTDSTKTITIRRNKISYIEVSSFPSSLRVLNLDWNRLEYIQRYVLDNLKNLEELTLSNNKLSIIPYMSNMVDLQVINMASNQIVSMDRQAFASADYLKILDLSYNKITDPHIIHSLFIEGKQGFLKVNLAFNRLKYLNVRNSIYLVSRTFVLFGNPWDCGKLKSMSKVLICHVTKCDLQFFSSGKTPYCINYGWGKHELMTNSSENELIEKFQAVIQQNAHLVKCDLVNDLLKRSRANPRIDLCDDSEEESFRVSLLQDRLVGSILD